MDDDILRQKRRSSNIINGYTSAQQFVSNAVSKAKEYVNDINIDLMQNLSEDYGLTTLENDLD